MYKFILFLLLFFCNLLFCMDNSDIVRMQFSQTNVEQKLKNMVPFLQQDFTSKKAKPMPSKNQYILQFNPHELTYDYFAQVTGRNIFNAKFVVSWYVFTNLNNIPKSSEQMLSVVNQKKPLYFSALTAINGMWLSSVVLPYNSMQQNSYVFAYISYPNTAGVLIPLGGQSFYYDNISDNFAREQKLSLNNEILTYWKDKGYL